jgi:glycosyltransferase involved in cell wall biosynthesis
MINVLHTIETTGPGGAENVLISLATGLDRMKFQSFVCLRNEGWLKDELDRRGVKTFIIEEKGSFDVGFLLKILLLVVREKISLIHAHEFGMSVYGSIVGSLARRRVVTTIHGRNYYWKKMRRRLAMRIASRLSQMVTVSMEQQYFLQEKTGIRPKMLKTIYNGIDISEYARNNNTASKKLELGINGGTKVVGTVGNLYPVKGQTYLLKAIPSILEDCPDVIFLFIGRGDQEQVLRHEVIDLGINEHVCFLGFRSDVPALLDLMDVFTLPSLEECLPLSVLEAMAKSVPPVVTDVGGNREIIKDGKTGFIVPPANPEALAEKIILLLKCKELAEGFGARASSEVKMKFSREAMLSCYESLYNTLLSSRGT